MNLREMLRREEGYSHKAYPDPLTHGAPWTIGIGHTGPEVHEGLIWTDDQINAALEDDVAEKAQQCEHYFSPWFQHLNEARQAVLIGMCFQMGISRLLAFRNTLGMVQEGQWRQAAIGMMDSMWARQTHNRAERMAKQMETGEWA